MNPAVFFLDPPVQRDDWSSH